MRQIVYRSCFEVRQAILLDHLKSGNPGWMNLQRNKYHRQWPVQDVSQKGQNDAFVAE